MKQNKKLGQTLLLVALMVAVAATVVVIVSQNATQQVIIATQETESKRAFAAAEAGIQAALDQDGSEPISLNSLDLGQGIEGQTNIQYLTTDELELPLLGKDETYTFYFDQYKEDGGYSTLTPTFTITKLSPQVENYCSEVTSKFALELSFIDLQNNSISGRRLIDPCSMVEGDESEEVDFDSQISGITASLMTIRVIAQTEFEGSKIRINKPEGNGNTWPAQGKTITSQANTDQQISKRVKLFQSSPQPPTEFYTTRF